MEGDRVVHQIGQHVALPADDLQSPRSHWIAGDGQHLAVYVDRQPALHAGNVGRPAPLHNVCQSHRDACPDETYGLRNHRHYRRFVEHQFIFSPIILFLVSHFNFLFVPCGGLSWLAVSFLLHVKYTLSYRISYRIVKCPRNYVIGSTNP